MPQTLILTRAETHSPLALWHLLSLDAPTVATLWLVFVAHATQTTLPPLLAPAMFLAVWILYVTDRLLDVARHTDSLEARHHFHHLHRSAFVPALAAAGLALAILLARTHLPMVYLPLAGLLIAWFAALHFSCIRLPKELVTGVFFSAAIFAPELAREWPEALAFALLCTVNCAWINRWESFHRALRYVPQVTAVLLLLALHRNPVSAAIALAAAALLVLDRFRRHLQPITLRAAADLALLTPILFLAHVK